MPVIPLPRGTVRLQSASVVLVLAIGGCTDSGPSRPTAVVRDSTGVTIVETPALGPGAALPWALDTVPLVDVGTVDGPAELQLYQVRDALRLPDGGGIAVLNAGTREIRLYTREGAHRATFGGEGEGPGELSNPASLTAWPGDSLGVWDGRVRRLTVFAPDGTPGRVFTLPRIEEGGITAFSHRLSGGILAVVSLDVLGDGPESGHRRVPVRVLHLAPEGTTVADLGEHPGDETFMSIAGESVHIVRPPFARGWVAAAHGDQTIFAPNDRVELRYYATDGSLVRIARVAEPPRLTTEADRAAYLAERLADAPEQARPGIRALHADHPGPDTLPAFTTVLDDALGNTWIRTFRSPADTGPDRWIVLGPNGAALGTVALPTEIDVYEIGQDWVLGRWTDDLDVEHVRLWRLAGRPPG